MGDSFWRKSALFVAFSVLALFIIGVIGAVWGGLVYANLKTTPSAPWSLPVIAVVLWFLWLYLGGKGWPKSTAGQRKVLHRANPVSRDAFVWSFMAGMLAIISILGLWIVLFELFNIPPNRLLPANFASSRLFIASIILGGSLVAPITEESAVRGYLQSILEREFAPSIAVVLSSLVFALAHVTQGLSWPKFMMYFLVGVVFGSLAFLNRSILPVIPVHFAADVIAFVFVWPYDANRKHVWQTGADFWFWLHVAQVIVFAGLSVLAFRSLRRRLSRQSRVSACVS